MVNNPCIPMNNNYLKVQCVSTVAAQTGWEAELYSLLININKWPGSYGLISFFSAALKGVSEVSGRVQGENRVSRQGGKSAIFPGWATASQIGGQM